MDTRTTHSKIQDYVIIKGFEIYANDTFISLTDRMSKFDISNL